MAPDDNGHPSAQDMQTWLAQEIIDSAKAFELRVREATGFVTAYSLGQLTPEQADEMHSRYEHRWGEALAGVNATPNLTDEEITLAIDRVLGEYSGPQRIREQYVARFKHNKPGNSIEM